MLTVENLNKSFRRKEVLKNINLCLDNKIYGLLGPNGSGKTTLLRCITGVYPPTSGKIFIDNFDVTKTDDFKKKIGYLPQSFGMYKELTSTEMLKLFSDLKGLTDSDVKAEAQRVIKAVDLEEKKDEQIKTLSGGQVRRLGIAQALLGSPEYLFFDEPTAGLDPEERIRFKNIISELKGEHTIIISTHIVDDVESLCDEIIVMFRGKIATIGKPTEIAEKASGRVFSVNKNNIVNIKAEYFIRKEFEENGIKKAIIVSRDPVSGASAVEPTLEDGYICITRGL